MIIDAHVHCGIQDKFPPQSYDDYVSVIRGIGIRAAVMFPPVMEIYNRYDPDFTDSARWKNRRKSANDYLLHLGTTGNPFLSEKKPTSQDRKDHASHIGGQGCGK
jgi:uncharacterized protein